MHLHAPDKLTEEVSRAEDLLTEVAGQRPKGFRGPGFSWSPRLLEVLASRGYLYDASTLPTYLGPLARLYFLATANLTAEERERRAGLFGSFRDGLRPAGAYHWRLPGNQKLLEIPVTTVPVVKTPFHMSYLLYLRRFSRPLMVAYFRSALAACRVMRVQPSLLLHPLDILSANTVPQLAFFPGMDLPEQAKRQAVVDILAILADEYQVVTMNAHASRLLHSSNLRELAPSLALADLPAEGQDPPRDTRYRFEV
jgi:peptidoglycan-N-acetylglucosamine deacetylase